MQKTIKQDQKTIKQDQETIPAALLIPVPTIAVRKSCNPDGVGLSHYVLMDRKTAK